jgi:hypothetical protein
MTVARLAKAAAFVTAFIWFSPAVAVDTKPNIVVILADEPR